MTKNFSKIWRTSKGIKKKGICIWLSIKNWNYKIDTYLNILFSADSDNPLAILGHVAQLQGPKVLKKVWILSAAWKLKSPMPDKFSKIYQNKNIGVGFFIKSQIPEVVKDSIRFQLLSNIHSYSCLFGPHWLKNNRRSAASSLQGLHNQMQQGLWL